jgi:hypothetical protein
MHAEVCIEKKNQPSFFFFPQISCIFVDDDDDDGLPILSQIMV